jgi:hypothetical protein
VCGFIGFIETRRTMEFRSHRIKITIGGIQLLADLQPNRTAQAIVDALPISAPVNQWGEEFYCKVPGVKDHRETAKNQVKVGDVAFWGNGEMLAVFFGRTPMSLGEDPVPADRVNVIGKIQGDSKILQQAVGATTMQVELLPEGA